MSTKISFKSRYTDIVYNALRCNQTSLIYYMGTTFQTLKQWIDFLYYYEEVTMCSFIIKNIKDPKMLTELTSQLYENSRQLDVEGKATAQHQLHLDHYFLPPKSPPPPPQTSLPLPDHVMPSVSLGTPAWQTRERSHSISYEPESGRDSDIDLDLIF